MTQKVAVNQVEVGLFEELYMKGFIEEGEYQAGLRFKWLSRKIRPLILSPHLSQAQLIDPHLRISFEVDEAYVQGLEKEWRNAWITLQSVGKRAKKLIENFIVYDLEKLHTVYDLKLLKSGLQALEELFKKKLA
ncbi:MAG: hypothetical protein IBJ00_02940 [Alphaproteobacteria bacterium]|nr:hypothetical protein [Alphaproteobacteria bacterium]